MPLWSGIANSDRRSAIFLSSMVESPNYRRMSRDEAAEYATELAEAFLRNLPPSDWKWEVGGATPKTGHDSGRKASSIWMVGFRWIPTHGGIFDGGGSIEVDLTCGEGKFIETP
jgi:hypothetical protein